MEKYNINGKIIIGIDHGYGNMKTRHTVFKSGVRCFDSEPPVASNVLEYRDKYYVIGEHHKVFIANKDEDDDYYILTLAAIAKELKFRQVTEADVILAVGLPLHWMKNQMKGFHDYLKRDEHVTYRFCGKEYRIRIFDVAVFPQGYSGVAAYLSEYRGVNMLADIGNGTMNTLVITNGRGMSDRMYTDKLGVQQCVTQIYNEVQAECGKVPDEILIEDFLRFGHTNASDRIQAVMRKEAEKYTQKIFDKLSEYEYDPELVKLHIIGGGGCLIKNFGTYDHDSVEIITDICATAKGYEDMYISKWRRDRSR